LWKWPRRGISIRAETMPEMRRLKQLFAILGALFRAISAFPAPHRTSKTHTQFQPKQNDNDSVTIAY
jgi:hypothetical protein